MKGRSLLPLLLLVAGCSGEQAPDPSGQAQYRIDHDRVTVSGVSSGAYMAGQLHVAHSELFTGAGLIAGGPYHCAQSSMQTALGPCINGGDVGMESLVADARELAAGGVIDALDGLAGDRVWLFHGSKDDIVAADLSHSAAEFYSAVSAETSVELVMDQPFIHSFATLDSGVPCNEFASPYLMACDYDTAGVMLQALYGELEPRAAATGELISIAQPGAADAEMLAEALLYVPGACADGAACGLHVALHGCLQSSEEIGDAFASGAGFNEWAESNRLLVLYPQVAKSRVAPLNPRGCWDWWGYTGDDYATRDGPQVKVIKATIDAISDSTM